MVKNVDYESRRRSVLTAAINRYIQRAIPVASEELAADFELSSATIRNIFAELEGAGYLRHPYTSGGRIPTDRGYRYYVDFLISQMGLLDEEKESIANEYKKEIRRLEDVLDKTSEVISIITHYTGIVSLVDRQDRLLCKGIGRILEEPEFQDLEKIKMLMEIIEGKERLLDIINRDFSGRVKVYIGAELGCAEMQSCALVVSSYRCKNKPAGRLAVLGPARMRYRQIIPTLEYISDMVTQTLDNI